MRTRLRGGYSGLRTGVGILSQLIELKGCQGDLVFENKPVNEGEAGGIDACGEDLSGWRWKEPECSIKLELRT